MRKKRIVFFFVFFFHFNKKFIEINFEKLGYHI
jgi:hypothetical protein